MTLRARAVVPPMVLSLAPNSISTPVPCVAQREGARGIDADKVAVNHVIASADAFDVDAVEMTARDDVEVRHRHAADGVAVGAADDLHAVKSVARASRVRGVDADKISLNKVVRGGAAADIDAILRIPGDGIAGPRRRAADGVVVGAADDLDAVKSVGQTHTARGVDADKISLNKVVRGVAVADINAVVRIARDDVLGGRSCSADRVVRGTLVNIHAFAIGDRRRASPVRADEVALDHAVRGKLQIHAEKIAGDDVAGARRRVADGVVACSPFDDDARAVVADGRGVRGVRSDQVSLNHIVIRVEAADGDAVGDVARNNVALSRQRAANEVVAGLRTDQNAGAVAPGVIAIDIDAKVIALNRVVIGHAPRQINR